MSPTTSAQVKRREAARKTALARQDSLDEHRRRRDQQELDLAVEFMEAQDERIDAEQAIQAAEVRMGRAVDALVGKLRISYSRAAQLLAKPVGELKRLRHLAIDHRPAGAASNTVEQDQHHEAGAESEPESSPSNKDL